MFTALLMDKVFKMSYHALEKISKFSAIDIHVKSNMEKKKNEDSPKKAQS